MMSMPQPKGTSKKEMGQPKKRLEQDIYGENSLWRCKNLKTGLAHNINGALAQILKSYPRDYNLKFISPSASEGE